MMENAALVVAVSTAESIQLKGHGPFLSLLEGDSREWSYLNYCFIFAGWFSYTVIL